MIRTGEMRSSERTDPDYIDKRLAALKKDFKACPEDWRGCFLKGLSKLDRDSLLDALDTDKL